MNIFDVIIRLIPPFLMGTGAYIGIRIATGQLLYTKHRFVGYAIGFSVCIVSYVLAFVLGFFFC